MALSRVGLLADGDTACMFVTLSLPLALMLSGSPSFFLNRGHLIGDVLLRCITHYPRQRYLFLLRDFVESFVEIGREGDRCADRRCALSLHASSLSLFSLHRGLPL